MAAINWIEPECTGLALTEVVSLAYGEIYCLPDDVSSIRVLNGSAWITSQAKDHILEASDQVTIPPQPYAVIVSAFDHQPLRFELRKL